MTYANDLPLLVAPRPVRITSSSFFTRSRHVTVPSDDKQRFLDADHDDLKLSFFSDDKDIISSPRASPRSALPTEALEEFLSILRPSFFPPSSPNLRSRRSVTLPTFQYERNFNFKTRARLENMNPRQDPDDLDTTRSNQPSRNAFSTTPDYPDPMDEHEDLPSMRWFASTVLSSPISRMHTRNPFQRHASNQSPGYMSPLSPAAVPLPLPTPDEMIDMY